MHDKMLKLDLKTATYFLICWSAFSRQGRVLVSQSESLIQDFPETSVLDELIVDQVHQVVRVVYGVDHFARARLLLVESAPLLLPESEGFVLMKGGVDDSNFLDKF